MTDPDLRELLKKLHAELEHVQTTDEPGREMLQHLDADIRDLLERSGKPVEADDPMLERFQNTIDHFETTYPRFTIMISEMLTILSNAGI